MTLLDLLAGGTRDLLGAVMPEAAATLWVPLLFVVLWLSGVLFVKHAVAALGRIGRMVLTGAAVGVGALLLLPEFAFATAYRRAAQRPPALVYGFGDIVAAGAGTIGRHAAATVEALAARVARLHPFVVLLLVVVWMWLWNGAACADDAVAAGACAQPVSAWWSAATAT
jgi:hypothetical protein